MYSFFTFNFTSDYAQYISQVAGLDPGIQGLHSLQSLPDGTTVAFIDASIFDASQILDNGAIEVQTLADASQELQQVSTSCF